MTDEQLDELMRRVNAGDGEAQAQVDAWIEEALSAICATGPIDRSAQGADPEALAGVTCCGTCSGGLLD